ncbi:hypothetical protein DFR26_0372 [Paraperlucidibaca baekdonensis]|uniref:Uncharacterized protein n=1 Tax=Paraperlucidibaca baekdonensis TaxID=748120 RepID=A0A3E0H937_9GAMM|nr:hypothetical protein [Paraperlucidibaca baekdonensis]REH40173.1 hypothetical protein DFR26_0372 [Paraperlucidibaca baekdonensis]
MDNRYWLLGLTTLTLGNAWAGGLQTLETVTVESITTSWAWRIRPAKARYSATN